MLSRRQLLSLAAATPLLADAASPLIETHLHLFDPDRFPYHPKATYKPEPLTLATYAAFAKQAGIDGVVIVHPEPYQDDHSYLEWLFKFEPRKGFFKGTALFDPIDPKTPERLRTLVKRNPGRIVTLRIHENREAGVAPTTSGPIRDRDLKDPNMAKTWKAVSDLGLSIQMHFVPLHAPEIMALAKQFSGTPVILDHLARAGQGTPEQYNQVLAMAKLPKVVMKFSGVGYSSKEKTPFRDAKPLVKRTFEAFGPDRMIWGGLGHNMEEHKAALAMFDEHFDFASPTDKAKIRGFNAVELFHFRG
jgi:L-fuconolactonase